MEKDKIDIDFEKNLNNVSESVRQSIQEKDKQLVETRYYKEFVINTPKGQVVLNDVYITVERNKENDMEYHFRWICENEQGEMTIEEKMMADKNGKVYSIDSLEKYFEDSELDVEQLFQKNDKEKGRLLAIAEEGKDKEKNEKLEEQEKPEDQEARNDEEEEKKAQEDLKKDDQEIEISKFRKINDNYLDERMPDVFKKDAEYAIAYSDTLGSFVVLESREEIDEKGELRKNWRVNDNVKTAGSNYRSIISIDENGDKVERKVPYALLKTNRADKEIAITLEAQDYGELDIETVDVMECQERVSRKVRVQGQGIEGEEKSYLRKELNRGYKSGPENNSKLHDVAHGFEKEEKELKENGESTDSSVIEEEKEIPDTDLTYGDLANIKGITIQELIEQNANLDESLLEEAKEINEKIKDAASECNVSIEGYMKELRKVDGDNIDEKIEYTNEVIEEQYRGNSKR